MLVLTRKPGEAIHIGDDIFIKVSEISGNRVKLCIDAPKIMRILRAEVAEQIEQQQTNGAPVRDEKFRRRSQTDSHSNMSALA
ncbi:carbon storage regulator [Thalassoglobus polymorphus]|uniref:Translational regulator CsrA n=1 Tax=Thalassoglobus polymorphus TaxID=2527994 RepID=A0A517QK73_9PLAN|nr:carbon storage regulator [Thalassoglobus polymorphus]QDT32015.1 hypothetical protein Mal48_12550 [Thalassoglobus polymorphus]